MHNYGRYWFTVIFVMAALFSAGSGARITFIPPNIQIETGKNFLVDCQVEDAGNETVPPNIGKVWSKLESNGIEKVIGESGRIRMLPWTKKNSYISSILLGDNATKEDAGIYKCSFGDQIADVTVSVTRKFQFVDTPVAQHPISGHNATIKCRADSDWPVTISWSRDGKTLGAENNGRYSFPAEGDMVIKAFEKANDDGIYKCEASERATGTRMDLHINVTAYAPPDEVKVELEDEEQWPKGVHEDASAHLSCSATGFPSPTLKWMKNGADVTSNDHFMITEEGTLVIINVTAGDAGIYVCDATNVVGQNKGDVELRVYLKPRIDPFTQENRAMLYGHNFTEVCRYSVGEDGRVEWTFMDKPIHEKLPDEQEYENDNGRYYIVTTKNTAELHVRNATLDNTGDYKCIVSNDAGDVSSGFYLQVQTSPEITLYNKDKKVRGILNQKHNIFCGASGVPTPTIFWSMKSGTEIHFGDGHYELDFDAGYSSLNVTAHSDNDFGIYVCKADNAVEPPDHVEIELVKIEIPDRPVVSCFESATGPTSITLQSETYSSLQRYEKQPLSVHIGIVSEAQMVPNISDKFATSGLYKITKLLPEQQYSFYVSGENEAGISSETMVSCRTTEPRVPGKPRFLQEDKFYCNGGECSLDWELEDDGGRDVMEYRVEYYPVIQGEPDPVPTKTSTPDKHFAFANLQLGITYRVAVLGVNVIGGGEEATISLVVPQGEDGSGDDSQDSGSSAPTTGAIVAIVVILVLIIVLLIDVACYYVNQCGLLMCLCVNLCGKAPPESKAKAVTMEEGTPEKESKANEKQEKVPLKDEQSPMAVEHNVSESTPMISVEKPKEQGVVTVV